MKIIQLELNTNTYIASGSGKNVGKSKTNYLCVAYILLYHTMKMKDHRFERVFVM